MSTTTTSNSSSDTETSSTSSIILDHRHERSTATALLHTMLKPMKPRLVQISDGSDKEGSSPVEVPSSIKKKHDVEELHLHDMYLYSIKNKSRANKGRKDVKKDLYYFAGGSFMRGPSSNHWKFCCELADQLPEYQIYVVSPPLAPKNPASKALPLLRTWFQQVLDKAEEEGRKVTLAGDSSGANVAMSLALSTSDDLKASGRASIPLEQVMLICPPTDLQKDNPDIAIKEKFDPLMTKKYTKDSSLTWVGDEDVHSPQLSPLFATLDGIQSYNIKVHGVTAGYDVLGPDGVKFRQKLSDLGIHGNWLEWDKQMHCFPISFAYHLPESVQSKDWIIKILQQEL